MSKHHLLDPFELKRESQPFLMGDVFTHENNDSEFTLFDFDRLGCVVGVLNENGHSRLIKLSSVDRLLDNGYCVNEEYIEKSKELIEYQMIAPRMLEDGVWAGLTRLAFTTAICIDFDEINAYRTRYCFGHNSYLPSFFTATYWLSRMKTSKSLPIGNCAFRGVIGVEPIESEEKTRDYYNKMYRLKHEVSFIDGKDIHGVADEVNSAIFKTALESANPKYLSASASK